MDQIRFFVFFFNYMGTRMVQIRIAKSVWTFRNKTTNGFGAQIRLHPAIQNCKQRVTHAAQLLLHLANNTARTQIHNYLCQKCGGYGQGYGRIEVHSFLLKRRESMLAATSEVLDMLKVEDGRWFGRLDDDFPKVKWMRRVYPRVD